MADTDRTGEMLLPRDDYSRRLRNLKNHPEAVEKNTRIERLDFYGNVETWNVKTVNHDGASTVFLEKGAADNTGGRWLLPPEVVAAIYRHRDGVSEVRITRGAKKAAATRKAAGIKPFERKERT